MYGIDLWHIDKFNNLQALAGLVILIALAIVVYQLIPAGDNAKEWKRFSWAEITAYDKAVPKYFIAAALALFIGSLHTVIKNVPPFWQWLWEAGYGGHLFRDLSNTHIIIVGGGTMLLTGITWYVLPRFTNRPLFSPMLAGASFWFTLIGLFGFYMAWIVLGLIEGSMVRNGWVYLAAKDYIGNWHKVPTAMTASLMGFGYWAYVLNTLLTAFASRDVQNKPLGYLTKFSVVSALGLFIGTVQGVIQVLPDSVDWIQKAGKFGEFVDPISHAHVNLVTGVMVSLAVFMIYFAGRMTGRAVSERAANLIFWVLVPASLAFYLAFLLMGIILGGAVNGYGPVVDLNLAAVVNQWRVVILSVTGTALLAGFWLYFIVLWRTVGFRMLRQHFRDATPAAFWIASSAALVIGTFQGILQILPGTAAILTVPDEIPNIHAQLNMIGGVMLALMGIAFLLLPELVGVDIQRRLRRLSLFGIGSGIGSYYVVTIGTGLLRFRYLSQGMSDGQAAAHVGWAAPALLLLTAIPMVIGYGAFGLGLYRATTAYRMEWLADFRFRLMRANGPQFGYFRRIPIWQAMVYEVCGALVGFPGFGWTLSGRAVVGIPMAGIGAMLAWAVMPLLVSPDLPGPLMAYPVLAPALYLIGTATVSAATLGWSLIRSRAVEQSNEAGIEVKNVQVITDLPEAPAAH